MLPELFPHFIATQVAPSELLQLVEAELSGPSPKFLTGDLGILELDSGRLRPLVRRRRGAPHPGAHRVGGRASAGRRSSPTSAARPTATRRTS